MLNKVYLEGVVSLISDVTPPARGCVVLLKQRRKIGNYELTHTFQLFVNDDLGENLKTQAAQGDVLSIEGFLKTYRGKDGQNRIAIEVTKVNDITKAQAAPAA